MAQKKSNRFVAGPYHVKRRPGGGYTRSDGCPRGQWKLTWGLKLPVILSMTDTRSMPGPAVTGARQADATIYRMVEALLCDGSVLVKWGDAHQSKFHSIWLRHQCECAHCGTPLNAVRGIRLHHIPKDIKPEKIELVSDLLRIQWSDGHASECVARWLRDLARNSGGQQRFYSARMPLIHGAMAIKA